MHMFNVSVLYRQSIKLLYQKNVVGVDRPMKASSMHLQKALQLLGKICLSSHNCHFVKKKILSKLLYAYVQCVYIV